MDCSVRVIRANCAVMAHCVYKLSKILSIFMSKSNLFDSGGARRHSQIFFRFPYLTDPEEDELRRFRKIHIIDDEKTANLPS